MRGRLLQRVECDGALPDAELPGYGAERLDELFELCVDAEFEVVAREREVGRVGDCGEEEAEAAQGVVED